MKKLVWTIVASMLTSPAWATAYPVSSPNYTVGKILNFTSCAAGGDCQDYTTAMHASGSFTTSTPLAANLSDVDISGQITGYSFSDGVNTFASTNSEARLVSARVSTDADGKLTGGDINIQLWEGSAPTHAAGDFFNSFVIVPGTLISAAANRTCITIGPSDTCFSSSTPGANQSEVNAPISSISPVTIPVPSLSDNLLAVLAALLAASGLWFLRQGRQTA